jgi:hypothetical protein
MDWHFRSFTVIALLVTSDLLLGYPTPVDFSGELMRWNIDATSEPILYAIHSEHIDPSTLTELVNEAANIWSTVPTSYLRLAHDQEANGAQIAIHFDDGLSNAPYAAAYAEFDDYDDGMDPLHCSIHIDINQTGIKKTLLHELGHCIGLGHSLIPQSIMSYQDRHNDYRLDTDDAAAISRLYPIDKSAEQLPPGCAVSRASSIKSPIIFMLMLLILPLLLSARMKKRWSV